MDCIPKITIGLPNNCLKISVAVLGAGTLVTGVALTVLASLTYPYLLPLTIGAGVVGLGLILASFLRRVVDINSPKGQHLLQEWGKVRVYVQADFKDILNFIDQNTTISSFTMPNKKKVPLDFSTCKIKNSLIKKMVQQGYLPKYKAIIVFRKQFGGDPDDQLESFFRNPIQDVDFSQPVLIAYNQTYSNGSNYKEADQKKAYLACIQKHKNSFDNKNLNVSDLKTYMSNLKISKLSEKANFADDRKKTSNLAQSQSQN